MYVSVVYTHSSPSKVIHAHKKKRKGVWTRTDRFCSAGWLVVVLASWVVTHGGWCRGANGVGADSGSGAQNISIRQRHVVTFLGYRSGPRPLFVPHVVNSIIISYHRAMLVHIGCVRVIVQMDWKRNSRDTLAKRDIPTKYFLTHWEERGSTFLSFCFQLVHLTDTKSNFEIKVFGFFAALFYQE